LKTIYGAAFSALVRTKKVSLGGETMEQEFLVGDWRVRPRLSRIQQGDKVVRIEPRVMEVLSDSF
jgi:hypothetical protein